MDSEACLLASMILKNEIIPEVQASLTEDSFGSRPHKILYKTIGDAYAKLKRVDAVLIKDALGSSILDIGGISYLAAIVETVPDIEGYKAYLDVVLERWRIREAVTTCQEIQDKAAKGASLEDIYGLASTIHQPGTSRSACSLDALVSTAVSDIDSRRVSSADLSTGFQTIDLCLGGIRHGRLYTIGGKTSHGKTTFALNMALANLRSKVGCKVIYNAFEDLDQIPLRMSSIEDGIKLDWFLNPSTISESDYILAKLKLQELSKYKDRLMIVGGVSCSRMRYLCDEFKPDLLIVDYLQRYAHKFNLAEEGRLSHEIGKAVSDLQDIALDKKCAVLLLSQFSRRSEESRFRRPQLEDLKESGDIEFLSDAVILLWWKWRDNPREVPNDYLIMVEKNKTGPRLEHKAHIELETLRLGEWKSGTIGSM